MHYLKMIPIESKISIQIQTLDNGRKVSKLDISVLLENSVVAKAINVKSINGKKLSMDYKNYYKKSSQRLKKPIQSLFKT